MSTTGLTLPRKHEYSGPSTYIGADGKRRSTPEAQRAYRRAYKARRQEYDRKYSAKHPERKHASALRFHRKLLPTPTRPDPQQCECCGGPPAKTQRVLHLDHCHETNMFRGWLCNRCNTAIGLLGDSLEAVQRAVEYLRRAKCAAQN